MRIVIAASLILGLTACASQQIRCDESLRPINPPAVPAKKPAAPVEKKVRHKP